MRKWLRFGLVFCLELAVAIAVCFEGRSLLAIHRMSAGSHEIRVEAPKGGPHLEFASEMATADLEALFARPETIGNLKHLDASVALSLVDLSPARAGVVRRLNDAGVPVTAWLALPREQGYYANAENSAEVAARFEAFQKWTADFSLRWDRVGLDIEPSLADFGQALEGHWLRLAATLIGRYFDFVRVSRSRLAYAALIHKMERAGYPVDTYQFPFLADERAVGSTLLERLFGIVDVRGDREALMTYSSFNHALDSALVWEYGPDAQLLVVGVTSGNAAPGNRFRPLSGDELARDAAVAAHFSPVVGVYSLEGCAAKGFLQSLETVDWARPVTIPAEAIAGAIRVRAHVQAAIWTASYLPYLAIALLVLNFWTMQRPRGR